MPVVFLQFSQAYWILAATSGWRLSDILMVLPKYLKFSSLASASSCSSRLSGPIYIVFFLLIFSPLHSNALCHSSSWSCSVWQVSAISARSSANSSMFIINHGLKLFYTFSKSQHKLACLLVLVSSIIHQGIVGRVLAPHYRNLPSIFPFLAVVLPHFLFGGQVIFLN